MNKTTKSELLKAIRTYEMKEVESFSRATNAKSQEEKDQALSWNQLYSDQIDDAWRQYHSINK